MATVRITQSLIQHVKQSLSNLFTGKLNDLQKQLLGTLRGDEIYNRLVPAELQTLLATLPEGFVYELKEIRVRVQHQQFTLTMSQERPVKLKWTGFDAVQLDDSFPRVIEVKKLQAEVKAVEAERAALVTKVEKILNECVTLAQVCEVWPTVLDHIPKRAYERHIARKEKAAPVKPKLEELMDDEFKGSLAKATIIAKARQAA